MRALIQRVMYASVVVNDKKVAEINKGILVFLGIKKGDMESDADFLIKKIPNLRIFNDLNGKMNKSLIDINGELLVVSQFTLYADAKRGNRPSYSNAMPPDDAIRLYNYFCNKLMEKKLKVKKGIFGAHMRVELLNDGPVTIMLSSNND